MLLEFCKENEIPFDLCGKIVVATEEKELSLLQNLFDRGMQNGLDGFKKLSKDELKEYVRSAAYGYDDTSFFNLFAQRRITGA